MKLDTEFYKLPLRIDAERMAFHRQHFDADVADPHNYDVLLNSASIPIDACVDIVVRAFRSRFKAERSSG